MLRRPLWDKAGFVAVIVLGIRVCYLLTQYVVGGASVQRFHVESAAFLLVVVGLCYRAARSKFSAKHVPVPAAFAADVLSERRFDTKVEKELCVPSTLISGL